MEFICKYCGKTRKNANSLRNHERLCKQNPDHQFVSTAGIKALNQLVKNRGAWNKGLTKDTDERVVKYSTTFHKNAVAGKYTWDHCKHTQATKEKIRKQKLALCAKQGTNLCGKGLRGYYKGYYCQSSWELAYVIYNLDHHVQFERNKKGFKYTLDGIERSYFPDFYIKELDTYIEIKGYYDRKTKEKEKQFVGKLIIYGPELMQPILNYVIEKYGKNFVSLYE